MAASTGARNPFVRTIAAVLAVARGQKFRVALIGGFALPFHGVQRATGDVDFLADVEGAGALHAALVDAGARSIHRGADAANYSAAPHLVPVDFIFARRRRARDMLARATPRPMRGTRMRVPVVDAEALIGLKLQAVENAPARRTRDESDIEALLTALGSTLDLDVLRDYFRLFDREADMARLLSLVRKG